MQTLLKNRLGTPIILALAMAVLTSGVSSLTYGQKISETNLNGIVTEYHYDDQWGNLTSVMQDPGTTGHLNRTTIMQYDAAGRVTARWDPNNSSYYPNTSYAATVQYNSLGQPVMATFPAPNAETVHYYYGANGRIESVVDSHGTTALQYEDELYPLLTNFRGFGKPFSRNRVSPTLRTQDKTSKLKEHDRANTHHE